MKRLKQLLPTQTRSLIIHNEGSKYLILEGAIGRFAVRVTCTFQTLVHILPEKHRTRKSTTNTSPPDVCLTFGELDMAILGRLGLFLNQNIQDLAHLPWHLFVLINPAYRLRYGITSVQISSQQPMAHQRAVPVPLAYGSIPERPSLHLEGD